MIGGLLVLLFLFAFVAVVVSGETIFTLPKQFEGLWKGRAKSNIIGPFVENSFEFAISKAPNGDYLFEDNLIYDNVMIGYQRFYVESTGSSAGLLWYCGALSNFSAIVEQTGGNSFRPLKFPTETDSSVTFCLDSDNKEKFNPFKASCVTCDCANWTLTVDPQSDTLSIQLIMGGMVEGSNHLWTEPLVRVGPAPVIQDSDMPGHGSNFSCEFVPPGRDSTPVVFPDEKKHATDEKRTLSNVDSVTSVTSHSGGGCPFMKKRSLEAKTNPAKKLASADPSTTKSSYDYCYTLNSPVGYQLAWSLDTANEQLHCSVSAPVENEYTWVGIGFRPLSRSVDPTLVSKNTGHHYNFGMAGADIVAGSSKGGIRLLYAEQYTGAPIPSDALKISNSTVSYANGRMTLSFTRPLVGGYLHSNYGDNSSIVSTLSDILWAVGPDMSVNGSVECDYHFDSRGMRLVDWANPSSEFADAWKC